MKNVAVIGCGVVGSGVVELFEKNRESIAERAGEEIRIKKILDIRDMSSAPYAQLITNNADEIFNDESIDIVVETIGGTGAAFEYSKRALMSGKHLVSSNKELVSLHGPELMEIASSKRLCYMFEASVGGGIPIIRPLQRCLSANRINSITGILNGTTNYILTKMRTQGVGFEAALRDAQAKGYAEADPAADIDGHDACRKIAILSSIAYNTYIDSRSICTEGIASVSIEDMEYARQMNCAIKLVAESKRVKDNEIYARVGPVIMPLSHPLAGVEGVYNAILVNGDAIGDAMFYGQGAGKLPTASAVAADIIDIAGNMNACIRQPWKRDAIVLPDVFRHETRLFVRLKVNSRRGAKAKAEAYFDRLEFVDSISAHSEDELAFITGIETEAAQMEKLCKLREESEVLSIAGSIRIIDINDDWTNR